ncbi:hypothetical protein SPI_01044 [Niveomyces insectorum RCEF 264]|uniref:DUF7598 domain-containing protein n=1 Tax=Niveomyces insectorum RCEF 264 TaxID=1081102 RepID=A0A167YM87_9HYPO|nr:hypothetical protein SPI_01044 [Niveomyces insectorum RCEF 264]
MFNLAENSKLRGIGYRVLNVLRPCNIIALLAVVAASWVMVVMTGVTGQFFFFDAIAHVFISSIALFLILTEVPVGQALKRYFARTWPVFAPGHGFFWLGTAMVVLGCDMLANLNKPAFTVDNLGLPLWRVILAAGILCLTFGAANFAATLVFRDGPAGLTARMIRADGNLADGSKLTLLRGGSISGGSGSNPYYPSPSITRSARSGSARYNKETVTTTTTYGDFGGGANAANVSSRFQRMTQLFKKSPLAHGHHDDGLDATKRPIQISKPIPVGTFGRPSVDDHDHDHDADLERAAAYAAVSGTKFDGRSGFSSNSGGGGGGNYHEAQEDRSSPILPDVRRPPTALHPAMSSHYSVANMSQF